LLRFFEFVGLGLNAFGPEQQPISVCTLEARSQPPRLLSELPQFGRTGTTRFV
jgi:hypothetical protein